jgi:hypothetical protein
MALMESIPVILDRERHIRLTTRAMVRMEKLTGVKFIGMNLKSMGAIEVCALLYAGLLHEDPLFTLEKAEEMLDNYGYGCMKQIGEAVEAYLKLADEDAQSAENPQSTATDQK